MSDPTRHDDSPGPTLPQTVRPVGESHFGPPRQADDLGTLGRYRVLQKLGQGGMGAVYLGFHDALSRRVALKVMLPQYAADAQARERFLREARLAAMAKSDHVVTIYDVDEQNGTPFIAMEYLLGLPLDQFLKTKGELPLEQVVRIARETAVGLAAAHELGLIHRDIKPANVWLEAPKGRVKILDFGLARAQTDDEHLTGRGAILGTPAYMSPEQARGLSVDHRTDLFSLGVMLYRLCTGKMPFVGSGTMGVLTALAVDTPVAPRQHNAQLPDAVEAVVLKLLAKNPAERFQTAAEVADALDRVALGPLPQVVALPLPTTPHTTNVWAGIDSEESVSEPPADAETEAVPPSLPPSRLPTPAKRWPWVAGAVAGLAVAVATAALLWPKPNADTLPPALPPPLPGAHAGPPPSPKPAEVAVPGKEYPAPADLVPATTPMRPDKVFSLDWLDPTKHLPPDEEFAGQSERVAALGTGRQRLNGPANALAVGPSGTPVFVVGDGARAAVDANSRRFLDRPQLACLSADGTRGAAGKAVYDLTDPKRPPVEYPLLPDGEIQALLAHGTALVGHGDGKHAVWKLDPKEPKKLTDFGPIFTFAASPDRARLAVVGMGQTCVVYDVTADGPKERFELPGNDGKVFAKESPANRVDFAASGLLATVDPRGAVRVWDVSGAAPKLMHSIDWDENTRVALFPAGDRVVRLVNNEFAVWALDVPAPRKVAVAPLTVPFALIRCALVTPDGNTVVTGHASGAVRFWEIQGGALVERKPVRPNPQLSERHADLSPDGRFAVLWTEDGLTEFWNLTDLTVRKLVNGPHRWARFGPTGEKLYISSGEPDAGLEVRSAETQFTTPVATFADRSGQRPVCVSPDGKLLVAASDAQLVLWDVSAASPREVLPRVPLGRFKLGVFRFSPDGRYLVAVRPNGGAENTPLRTWALTPRGLVPRFESDELPPAHAAALAPDGRLLLALGAGIMSYELSDGVPRGAREYDGGAVPLAVSPDGRLLATAVGQTVRVVARATGETLREWPTQGSPGAVRFHPDGGHLLYTDHPSGVTYILRLPKAMLAKAGGDRAADRRAAEMVLARGGTVRLDAGFVGPPGPLPGGPFTLVGATVKERPLTAPDAALLAACSDLVELTLDRVRLTDDALGTLAECPGLKRLFLHGNPITDAGLARLHRRKFEQLGVTDCEVTDTGLAPLVGPGMFQVRVNGTKAGDTTLARLAGGGPQKHIGLARTAITNDGLRPLAGVVAVGFDLSGTAVTDAGLKHLEAMAGIQTLNLNDTKVTADGVRRLQSRFPNCGITWGTDPDRSAAEYVLALGGEVTVSGTERAITARADLPAGAFKLLTVRLRNKPDLLDAHLSPFARCEHIQTLDLRDCPVTDAGLANFRNAHTIAYLLLDNTKVTDAGLEWFRHCKNLEHLSLVGTQVTDTGLALVRGWGKLASLSVRGTKVTPKAAEAVRGQLPKCDIDILDMRK